jgi:DNA-binding winged helix-turn-helix (wHTH) protein/TolB-like protein
MANYQFGPFCYDPEQRLLFREGQPVPLAPKATDTLHILLEHRGRIVEKPDLMKWLWPDTTVDEVGLARNISILRKVLEESGGTQYIETVPRRGYRFVAGVAEAVPPGAVPAAARRLPRRMALAVGLVGAAALIYWQFYVPSRYVVRGAGSAGLAVVPFEPDTADATSGRAITDLLVADLAKTGGIQVVSPSTVRRHQRFGISMGLMGRLLGLDVLVEGSVRESGGRVLVTARLVDVHTGKVIWGDSYDRARADGDGAQIEVARQIATEIAARLGSGKR